MAERIPPPIVVRGTEILATDPPRLRRQKIARVTLDSMVQFVGLLDANGTVLEINKVALDAVGLSIDDVEGKPFWTTFWWQVSEEVNEGIRGAIARAAKGEFVRWDTPLYASADGSITIIIDASLMPVKDDAGNVVFIAAEGRDITEKKAHEREIAAKNIELQGLLERIRELDEIKTQFFANVSHELRTPLALILGPAQRLIDEDEQIDATERRSAAQVIARNARMLLRHVNDLLDISRLEARKLRIELQEADVAALVRLLASHFAVLAADRSIDFVVDADDSCMAAVDPDKLQRVLMNLLGNAFKFVPDGGRVRVSCAPASTPREVTLSVEDSGPGVAPELRQAIFERFRQGDGGPNRKAGGTGLGLAIAKEFVELHKGRIEVGSSDLGGARFDVTLPRNRADDEGVRPAVAAPVLAPGALEGMIEELRSTETQRPSAGVVAAGERPRVLVVEDNQDMNRFISGCLSASYDVTSAFDGREGLASARRLRPALIVSDIMMPNVSGVELLTALRADDELQTVPVLLLSAKADEELMVTLLDGGAQDFIVKPFSEKLLRVRVRNLLAMQSAREAAERANRAKDEFLAMLGHELRNPLSPIQTALQLMKLQGPEGGERARTVIERQVSHLTRLVDDLLDVSRIARGKVELKMELVEMCEIANKAIELASPIIERRRHALSVDVPGHGLTVNGDPTRLGQVVSNLLTNAAKYTPEGGRIAVSARQEHDEVVLRVRDTGAGIAPEMLPRIFDLFVQEGQAVDRSQGGLGIGLTIVRNLIQHHGGSVAALSGGPGKGTEFIVRLPIASAERQASDAAPAAPAAAKGARESAPRILVVDDNVDAAEMLAEVLGQKGYETRTAYDPPAAIREAADFRPDVALLDIGLPVMDGYELATHLRALPGLSEVKLIALTGYGQASDHQRTRDAGFRHHLVKPVDLDALEAAVEKD